MLVLACRYYLLSLKHGVQHSLQVFRLTSLWLENNTHEEVCEVLEQHLPDIPSYKFLPVLPQLAPRIGSSMSDSSVGSLNALLSKYSKIVRDEKELL
jgi:ataxia telangiectasia mutated family protein